MHVVVLWCVVLWSSTFFSGQPNFDHAGFAEACSRLRAVVERVGLNMDAQRSLSKFLTDQNAGLSNGHWSADKVGERLAKAKLWWSQNRGASIPTKTPIPLKANLSAIPKTQPKPVAVAAKAAGGGAAAAFPPSASAAVSEATIGDDYFVPPNQDEEEPQNGAANVCVWLSAVKCLTWF